VTENGLAETELWREARLVRPEGPEQGASCFRLDVRPDFY